MIEMPHGGGMHGADANSFVCWIHLLKESACIIFLTKVTFGVGGTYGEVCTILLHTWTFVQKSSVQCWGLLLECVPSPKGILGFSLM